MPDEDAANMRVDVRALRKDAGMTQTELADLMGVKQQTVSKWEKGEPISRSNAVLLCHALGIVGEQALEIVENLAPGATYSATITIGPEVNVSVEARMTALEAEISELRQLLEQVVRQEPATPEPRPRAD